MSATVSTALLQGHNAFTRPLLEQEEQLQFLAGHFSFECPRHILYIY